MTKKKTILLNGPTIGKKGAYGGGTGGMTRNMAIFLEQFASDTFQYKPCFNSVARAERRRLPILVYRLIRDVLNVAFKRPGASGIHIFGQYHRAFYREWGIIMVCRLLGLPVLYQVRAGDFIEWHTSVGGWKHKVFAWMMRSTKVIICEGKPYVTYLKKLGFEGNFYPNYVPYDEIPEQVPERLQSKRIKMVFVGFAYEGKGVFEMIDGCELAQSQGLDIELTMIGSEAEDFKEWLDAKEVSFTLNRLGRRSHDEVLQGYNDSDLFLLPSRHKGEGHNNALNEAMMMGCIIVTTRHGFMASVLGDGASYFLETATPQDIAETLIQIDQNRGEARARAAVSRGKILDEYNSKTAFEKLNRHYHNLTAS